jgi:subtilisin-like proprotein convertase family protein
LVLFLNAGLLPAAPPRVTGRKVRVSDPVVAWQLRAQGATLLADYGGFQLLALDPSRAAGLIAAGRAEARDEEDLILLNSGPIDTTVAAPQAAIEAFEGRRLHLVQFIGPVKRAWYAALEKTGVQVVAYIPNNAYLIYGDASSLKRVRDLGSFVQWNGPYAAANRIQSLGRGAPASVANADLYAVQLVFDPATNPETSKLIDALRIGEIQSRFRILKYEDVVTRLDPAGLSKLAARPDVVSIQPYVVPKMRDERQGQIVAGALQGNGITGPGYLSFLASKGFTQAQFDASGFVVDISDSGIDNGTTTPNHYGLYANGILGGQSRVVYNRHEGIPLGRVIKGCDGHGNLNAHIVGGFSDRTGFPHEDGEGYNYGVGVAPFVKMGSSVIFDPFFTYPNFLNLESHAYASGARISSNSWGALVAGAYDFDAQTFDALVRDAQRDLSDVPAAGNQGMTIVFAAGNEGPDTPTLISPGTAKNVITVGASENVQAMNGADQCFTDALADSANDVAMFSSRGPTADGRRKPDLVAPGTHVSGGVIQADAPGPNGTVDVCFDATGICPPWGDFFPQGQELYTTSSGTSHSAPAVAGGAALVRQYFINHGLTPPSPAMTKAFLMNAARYLTGAGAGDTLPSNAQGMGLMDLGAAFDGAPRMMRDQTTVDTLVDTGQTRTFSGTVSDPTQPFRVTLAWTDAPGSIIGAAYVNNLDLTVQVGGVTYYGNVFSGATSVSGGAPDVRNNVESVFLPAGVSGPFTITVTAANISGDGVPGIGGNDQDFALVMYNAAPAELPHVVAAGSSIVAEGCGGGSGNGAVDPGETVTVALALANLGNGPTSDLVATLLPTNGVTAPSGPQSYGALGARGAAVSRPFTFTAAGTCGGSVTATLQLSDGPFDLGTVTYSFKLGTEGGGAATTFSNSAPITIQDKKAALPYPSPITVSGLSSSIFKVTVTLSGLTHAFLGDVDALLIGPQGQKVMLMSDAGSAAAPRDITLTFDDGATGPIPNRPVWASGTYRPANYEDTSTDQFTGPGLTPPYQTALAALNGADPNGVWRLYVRDDFSNNAGFIARGWSLSIQTAVPSCCVGTAAP